MIHLRLSAKGLSAWLVSIVGLVSAVLLQPVPAGARTEHARQASNDPRTDQLGDVISRLSDSRVFDSLVQSDTQQFAQYRAQAQPGAKVKRLQQAAKIRRPQQAAKVRRPS